MNLAIIFSTGRESPRVDWICEGIAQQAQPGDEITLIVVDAFAAAPSRTLESIGFGSTPAIVDAIHSAPKPTIWQGPHRVTSRDWFALSNARNTGLCLVPDTCDFVAFLDDRARLGPRWLDTARIAARERSAVIAGSYEKKEGDGSHHVDDHRRKLNPGGKRDCGGGWLYTCSVAMPLAWALEVNGYEEGCDGLSGEDYIFGLMLSNAGRRVDFVPDLFVSLDRTAENASTKGGAYICKDLGVSPRDKSHSALDTFGKRNRTDPRFTPDLSDLRARRARGEPWPDPVWAHRDSAGRPLDWFTSGLIAEL